MLYLSNEWLEAADAAVQGLDPTPEPFSIGYVVTDGPEGDRAYTLTLGPERVAISSGTDSPVGLRMTWETARAIAQSERSAQRSFLDGDLRIDGDAQALVGHRNELISVEQRLADLRSRTSY